MAESGQLHRSAEMEDLTHLTEDVKKNIEDPGKGSLHRSVEMEDLAHLSPQDINKPLTTDQNNHLKH